MICSACMRPTEGLGECEGPSRFRRLPVQIDPRELMQREAAIVGVMGPATGEEDAEAFAFISAGQCFGFALRPALSIE